MSSNYKLNSFCNANFLPVISTPPPLPVHLKIRAPQQLAPQQVLSKTLVGNFIYRSDTFVHGPEGVVLFSVDAMQCMDLNVQSICKNTDKQFLIVTIIPLRYLLKYKEKMCYL